MVAWSYWFGSKVRHVTAAEAGGKDCSLHGYKEAEKQEGAGDKMKPSRGTLSMSYFHQVGLTSCFPPPSNDEVT